MGIKSRDSSKGEAAGAQGKRITGGVEDWRSIQHRCVEINSAASLHQASFKQHHTAVCLAESPLKAQTLPNGTTPTCGTPKGAEPGTGGCTGEQH